MTNRTDMVSPDALVLAHALEKLRARDGLTHSRLDNSRSDEAAPLLALAAVRRYAAVHDIEPARPHWRSSKSVCGKTFVIPSASWPTQSWYRGILRCLRPEQHPATRRFCTTL